MVCSYPTGDENSQLFYTWFNSRITYLKISSYNTARYIHVTHARTWVIDSIVIPPFLFFPHHMRIWPSSTAAHSPDFIGSQNRAPGFPSYTIILNVADVWYKLTMNRSHKNVTVKRNVHVYFFSNLDKDSLEINI